MAVTIRPFSMPDLEQLVLLWNASMTHDPVSAHRLLTDFVLDPHFAADHVLLAFDDSNLIGFAWGMTARQDVPGDNAVGIGVIVGFGVAETYRRQGIGTRLLQALAGSWHVNSTRIGPWIPTYFIPGVDEQAYPAAVPFLESLGYARNGEQVSMRALLTGYSSAAEVVSLKAKQRDSGIDIRPAEPADALALLAFARQHFPHWEGYVRGALQRLVHRAPSSTLLIATDADAVLGFAIAHGERFGPFGVDGGRRGQGIGAVLLSQTLQAMRSQGIHMAYFLWTSEQTARLYTRHGFEVVRRFTMVSSSPE